MENPKSEALNSKQIQNPKAQSPKVYDLEERTFIFAKKVSIFISKLPKTMPNFEYMRQLIRSSSSVGANYIEANESLSKKDFFMRIKISRKEAKETCFWLKLISNKNEDDDEKSALIQESIELTKIFGSIVTK